MARKTTFALLGDVHGYMHPMVALLERVQRKMKISLDFALQVGDFEPHRHEEDLRSMSAPSKYKQLGDYADFYNGRARFPCPIYFIGGNHEPYGWLEQHPEGFTLSPQCHYLGRTSSMHMQDIDLRVGGLTGIFEDEVFAHLRPSVELIDHISNKEFITFREHDVDAMLALPKPDVLLVHDWPEGLSAGVSRQGSMGNAYTRLLVDLLEPKLVACGHMHHAYEEIIEHPSGRQTRVVCLGHITQRSDAIAIVQWDGAQFTRLDA